jgi:hypothetical protein
MMMIVRKRVLGPSCEKDGKAVGGEEGEEREIYRNSRGSQG